MKSPYDTSAPKRPVNLSVNSDLLDQAKSAGVNLSFVLEHALIDEVRKRKAEAWLRDNRKAIQNYNQHILEHGTFSDDLRAF
ncbi:MAG: type II toxin-antitoxin system CcdA family antitoxin [Candidatus Eremiobacteraeota bacterium]|nr:type II toxin-antitoxin system CcdA family antitoxin [Candidatus Eremiobacteraeota bacterium]MCW5866843.1 type II toxin-antitoxin system CcdA family antitoxin [Candidatus Eremiobacteraeota bacterium]